MTPSALLSLQQTGALPRTLSPEQLAHLQRSLARHAEQVSADKLSEILDAVKTKIEDVLNPRQVLREGTSQTVTEGLTHASARAELGSFIESLTSESIAKTFNLDFTIDVAEKISAGAGKFVQQNADPEVVNLYPALELERFYERDVPRGFRRGKGGALIPVPDDDWPSRFAAAASASGDEDAGRVLEETGRMMARKDSPLWQSLGDGAGGYDDTLGNPFPPFAFNSGYRTKAVSRADAIDVGLIQPGDQVAGAELDFGNLFSQAAA